LLGRQDGVRRRKVAADNTKCADGKTCDLDFDASFKLIKQKLEE